MRGSLKFGILFIIMGIVLYINYLVLKPILPYSDYESIFLFFLIGSYALFIFGIVFIIIGFIITKNIPTEKKAEHSINYPPSNMNWQQQNLQPLTQNDRLMKLTKLVKMSNIVKINDICSILNMDRPSLLNFFLEIPDQYRNFKIEEDRIVIDAGSVNSFINYLDNQFSSWHSAEQSKMGKI